MESVLRAVASWAHRTLDTASPPRSAISGRGGSGGG
ncbi:hypothetical protein COLO4_22786 [Corchorus olitorius]|uniref:Uncharacterized protein n=1 Tax=Corchorus olitorius TaxID=93759 RepID=A0A1R3IJX6_9ROSI|nr:hypothetical protein COLO4_22786 [Corchorus olitorius]